MNEYKTIRKMMDEDHKCLPKDYKMKEVFTPSDYDIKCCGHFDFCACVGCRKERAKANEECIGAKCDCTKCRSVR